MIYNNLKVLNLKIMDLLGYYVGGHLAKSLKRRIEISLAIYKNSFYLCIV